MEQVWIIKDQNTGDFFTLLGSPHFTNNLELAQRFSSEQGAVLCEEQHIHTEVHFLDRDTIPAELMENGYIVTYRTPEEGEEDLLFTVVDANNQDMILFQCINSSLTLPPVEALNSVDLKVISKP